MGFRICRSSSHLLFDGIVESFIVADCWLVSQSFAAADRSTSATSITATHSFADCGCLYSLVALGGWSFPHRAAVLVNLGHAHHDLWLCVALDFDQPRKRAILSHSPAKPKRIGSGFRWSSVPASPLPCFVV